MLGGLFLLFVHLSQPLEEDNNFEIWGGVLGGSSHLVSG